jgi:uncharacterized membrane protein
MPITLFRKKAILTPEEAATVVAAIRDAEKLTSGEIRVYMETKNKFVDPLDRAKEVFVELSMHKTALKNGVLIYVATKDKEVCILADKGINEKVAFDVWQNAVGLMQHNFGQNQYVEGLVKSINYIGNLLQQYFPYNSQDKNELPDNIVFGK